SRFTLGGSLLPPPRRNSYSQMLGLSSSPTRTKIATSDGFRAARLLKPDRLPRGFLLTAAWRPPPTGDARSPRNLNTSRRFDLPDALGPTMKTRSWRLT